MKKILFLIGLFLVVAWSQTKVTTIGRQGWENIAYYGADSSSTQIVFHTDTIMRDSAGTLLRIDNGADSCSQPIDLIGNRGSVLGISAVGGIEPQGPFGYEWEGKVKSNTTDSTGVQYRIETRKRKYTAFGNRSRPYWGAWIPFTRVGGTAAEVIVDSVVTWDAENAADTWATQAHLFKVTGHQMRLCPQELATTISTDSIFHDSVYIYLR